MRLGSKQQAGSIIIHNRDQFQRHVHILTFNMSTT